MTNPYNSKLMKTCQKITFKLTLALSQTTTTFSANGLEARIGVELGAVYVEEFISYVEHVSVKSSDAIYLHDISSGQVIAVCYTLSGSGYAILDIEKNIIYEFSLETSNPYHGQKGVCYYAGPNNYFVEESRGEYVHTRDGTIRADAASIERETSNFSDYRDSISNVPPLSVKIADIRYARENPSRGTIRK